MITFLAPIDTCKCGLYYVVVYGQILHVEPFNRAAIEHKEIPEKFIVPDDAVKTEINSFAFLNER